MGSTTLKPFPVVAQALILLADFGLFLLGVRANSDYRSLVYTECINQTYTGSPESHSQTLSSLFQQLSAQSSDSKFSKATVGDQRIGISSLFQCRGDLRNEECQECVRTLAEVSKSLCKQAVGARVQLTGCYFWYETDGFFEENSKQELHRQTCSGEKDVDAWFEKARHAAFAGAESGVMRNNGFYEMMDGYVHVMAQCEGELGACECGECVATAVQIAEEECGSSVSGQVYFGSCFISYTYYPNGIPKGKSSSDKESNGIGNGTGRSIAIVLGGAAALIAGFILLKFLKSCGKKDDI